MRESQDGGENRLSPHPKEASSGGERPLAKFASKVGLVPGHLFGIPVPEGDTCGGTEIRGLVLGQTTDYRHSRRCTSSHFTGRRVKGRVALAHGHRMFQECSTSTSASVLVGKISKKPLLALSLVAN